MASETKEELKARFKAGNIPSESDYAALIDTIDAGGSSNAGVLVISADSDLRNEVMKRSEYTDTQYTFTNPYTYTTIPELLDAYSVISGTDVRDASQVIISNEAWDSALSCDISGSWGEGLVVPSYGEQWTSYTALVEVTSSGATPRGTSYPMYIMTKHTTVIPAGAVSESYGELTVYFPNSPMYGIIDDEIIDAIPRGRACMFTKRTRSVDGNWDSPDQSGNYRYIKTFTYWVPVNRGTTITTYELGQMYQDFEANSGNDEYSS